MNRNHVLIIGGALALLAVFYLSNAFFLPSASLTSLVWTLGLLGLLGFGLVRLLPRLTGAVPQPAKPPIRDTLRYAFERDYTVRVRTTLQALPDWPIRPLLLATADELFALKRSVQRAQAEGVPASFLQRISANIHQAAEGTWQVASKIDAVAQQPVDYLLLQPRIEQEMQKLRELIGSLKHAQEGIALLTLSSSHHDALANAELDLQALTRAVKLLEQSAL